MNTPLHVSAASHAIDFLEDAKILAGVDLARLRKLIDHLSHLDHRIDVTEALTLLYGQDKMPEPAETYLRQLQKRIKDQQSQAIVEGLMAEGDRLALVSDRKSGDQQRKLWFTGPVHLNVGARTSDLDNSTTRKALYENPVLPPELLGQAGEDQRPILLLTVTETETVALRDVFLQGGVLGATFSRDDYLYELLGYHQQRPIIAFRCRMGSGGVGGAAMRVTRAIGHHRPSAVLAVGIAFGKKDDKKQKLGDVLISGQVQSYESERLNEDGSHSWRGDRMPASPAWKERATHYNDWGFNLHAGLLLCGEKLVDYGTFRTMLATEFPQSLGGDMESAGLVTACHEHHVDWLVIKGISDWGDGSKRHASEITQSKRQHKAAYNAARVAYAAVHLRKPASEEPAHKHGPNETKPDHNEDSECPFPAARIRDLDQTDLVYDNFGRRLSMATSLDEGLRPATSSLTAHDVLIDWLKKDEAPPVFALLGEYGMGKTITCQRLYDELRKLRRAPPPPHWAREPLYFDLRQLSLFKNLERGGVVPLPDAPALLDDLIRHGWQLTPGRAQPDYRSLAAQLTNGALLIIDGLDECLVHLVEAQHAQFVQTWLNLVADVPRRIGTPSPRLLVSCRTNFFKNLADQRNLFTGQHRGQVDAAWYEALVLLPLNEKQIRTYLSAALPDMDINQVLSLVAHTHNLGELAQRPMTLKLIGEHIRELEAMRARGELVNSAALYGMVAKQWLERDNGKHHLEPEHKLRLMQALAAHLWRMGVRSLPYDELHVWFHSWRANQPDLVDRYAPAAYNQTKLEEDLRTATFVVRQEGDGKQEEGFRFAHSSLLEYFLARYLADAVVHDRPEDWAMAQPSVETLHFLADLLRLEQARPGRSDNELTLTLNRWRKIYRPQASELLLAYALGEEDAPRPLLAGFNLAGARLRGWSFGQPLFRCQQELLPMMHCDFSGADLRETRFDQVQLDNSNFSHARLDQSALQHCSLRQTHFEQTDLLGTVFRHCICVGVEWKPAGNTHRAQWISCPGIVTPPGQGILAEAPPPPSASLAWLPGHHSEVTSVAVSADGTRVVSGSGDGAVRVWDAASSECLITLRDHEGPVTSVAVNADGSRVVSGSEDNTTRIWDTAIGECLFTLRDHEGPLIRDTDASVTSVAISADGARVASGSSDGDVRVWDAARGECLAILRGHSGTVTSVAISADGASVVSGSWDGAARLWATVSGECLTTLRDYGGPVTSVAISADGARIVSGSGDKTARLWDAASGRCLATLRGHTGSVTSVALSADGARVVSGSRDKTTRLWHAATGECLATLRHDDSVTSVAISADGTRIVSGSGDKTARVWDAASGECRAVLRGHGGPFVSVAVSADGARVVSGSGGKTARVWDAASGECRATLRHDDSIISVAISADGARAVSGSWDGTARTWDAVTGKCQITLGGHNGPIYSVAISADGARVASGSWDGKVRIWDATSGECLTTLRSHEGPVTCVAISADGARIFSGSGNKEVQVWDATNGVCLATLYGHNGLVTSIVISADGTRLISGSGDGTAYVWDTTSGECITTLHGHNGPVTSVGVSADGARVVSGSGDGTARLWDIASGQCQTTLRSHGGPVTSVAISADGTCVVSGSGDKTARVWDTASGRCLCCYWSNDSKGEAGVAVWRPPLKTNDPGELILAEGEAWRFLAWQTRVHPSSPGRITRLPLVY